MKHVPLLILALAAAGAARAQVVPAERTPAEDAQAIGAQAAKDPAAAGAALNGLFLRLAAPRVVLPTWREVQQDRLRRDLSPRPSSSEPADEPTGHVTLAQSDRTTRESVDVILSRPLARVGLGAGWTATDFYKNDARVAGRQDKYAFLRLDLSRDVRPARVLPPPILVDHALTVIGSTGARVKTEEYAVDGLKLPKD